MLKFSTIYRISLAAIALAVSLAMTPDYAAAQSRSRGNTTSGRGNTTSTRVNTPRQKSGTASRINGGASTIGPAERVPSYSRPGNTGGNHGNHGNSGYRPGSTGNRPGQTTRPENRPGHTNRPGNRPGQNNRPDHRPGSGWRPEHRPDHRPGFRPGTSVHRPGRPVYSHSYRPPRPGGGYWGRPVLSPWRWRRVLPPPVRPAYVVTGVPTIGSVLGLAFGSLVDYGINSLYNRGYNVLGYDNGAVYLSNVRQYGRIWPSVTINYIDGAMASAQFQYWSSGASMGVYNDVYNQLYSSYGAPIEISESAGITTATWWGGSNTGYVTLSFGLGDAYGGGSRYYTNLVFGAY